MKFNVLWWSCLLLMAHWAQAQPATTTTEETNEEEAELLKAFVRSFALREKDTILIALHVPYEIVDWDRNIVRTISQVESFSLPEEYLTRLSRKGRYSVTGRREDNVLTVDMKNVHHNISVQGVELTDEVAVRIFVPRGVPLKVVCTTKTPEEQLRDLWLQQEVLTRQMKQRIRRLINTDVYPDVAFQEGTIVAAAEAPPGTRFLELTVESQGKRYQVVSRIGLLHADPSALVGRSVVFVAHNLSPNLRQRTNEGMVLVHEQEDGSLALMRPSDLPDFLLANRQGS